MTIGGSGYVIDADVLIQAHRTYYAFNICSGFWEAIQLHHNNNALIVSIDKVLDDVNRGSVPDDLKTWANTVIPPAFFCETRDSEVIEKYNEIINWANTSDFTQPAKAQFSTVSDAWLVAYAKAKNKIVITQETFEQNKKNRVKIPNACRAFSVDYKNSFDLLHDLGINLKL